MLIDCNQCRMQGTTACDDCVVTFLVQSDTGPVELDADEMEAVAVLSAAGLIAPLRLLDGGREAATS